jgi:O-antigen/teichoic acid export membrane protein
MNPREWIEIGRSSAFVGLAMLAGQSAVNLGPIILAFLIGNLEAGVFSAAMKLVLVVLLLDRALNSILLPLASRIHSQRPEEFQGFIRLVFKFVFSLIFPVAVCCGILAPWLVHLVFGDGYEGAVPHTRFLLGYVVLTLLNSVLMCSLLAAGEELRYSRLLLIGSIILAALVGLLTVLLGPVGAGLGVSLGELVMFAILLTTARRIMQIDLSGITLRFVVVGGLALGALILIPLTNPVGLIPFFTLFFFLTLMLVGVMTVREVRVLAGKII